MGRTHDITISGFDFDKIETEARKWEEKYEESQSQYAFEILKNDKLNAENARLRAALTEIRRWVADGDCSDDAGIWPGYATTAYKDAVRMVDNALSTSGDKAQMTTSENTQGQLSQRLDAAHAELVAARKIAALSKHESYEEIGDAIECVEAALVWPVNLSNISSDKEELP
jgi:hypothetical protein